MFGMKKTSIGRVESKAVNSMSGPATSMTTTIPDTVRLTQDPVKLMNYNRGYVYASNNKVAEAVASLPYRMYAYIPESEAMSLVTKAAVIEGKRFYRACKALGLNPGEPRTLVEIFNHPFLDLMENPAPGWTRYDWIKVVSTYLGLIGNAYVELTFKGGTLVSLTPLLSEYVTITYNDLGEVIKYTYNPQGTMKYRTLEPQNVLHLRNRTAGSVIGGMGNLEAALASVNLTTSTQAYISALMSNMAMPGGVFAVKNFVGSPTMADSFSNKLRERFGRKNRGKPMVTFGDVSYTKADSSMTDSRSDFFTAQAKQEIAACFGVPLTLLDESNSNRATAEAAKRSMLEYAVYPRAEMILGQMNTSIVKPLYDDRMIFSYDVSEALESDPKEQAEVLKIYVDSGVYSVDEARAVLGMPPAAIEAASTPQTPDLTPTTINPQENT